MASRAAPVERRHVMSRVALAACIGFAAIAAAGWTRGAVSSVPGKVVKSVTAAGDRCWLTSRDLAGTRAKPLTPPVGTRERRCDWNAVWSPDGSMVAFVREQGQQLSVMVVNADGTGVRRVARINHRVYSGGGIVWSPSGTALLFHIDGGPYTGSSELYRVGVDGSDLRVLAVEPAKLGYLNGYGWSPDETRVVLVRTEGEPLHPGRSRLQTVSPAGTGLATILVAKSVHLVGWSPDGHQVAFHRNCFEQVCELGVVDTATGAVEQLTHFVGHTSTYPTDWLDSMWRPGKPATIVYARNRTLYEVSPDTGATRVVRRLACPRKACDAITITLARISSDGHYAVLDAYDFTPLVDDSTPPDVDRAYRVDLDTGKLSGLPPYGDGDVFLP